jgi:hypothetical protein
MHAFQHVISGDLAVASVQEALHLEDGDVVNMADDLAVGPLGDVDGEGEVWTVEILPEDQAPLPPHWCTGVGVQKPDELARIFTRRRTLALGERQRLAAEWRACVAHSEADTLRHPVPGGIETRAISDYDPRVLTEVTESWQETRRIVGNTMGHAEDAMISDAFIFWRIRELARTGLLELEPFDASMRDSRARRAA